MHALERIRNCIILKDYVDLRVKLRTTIEFVVTFQLCNKIRINCWSG